MFITCPKCGSEFDLGENVIAEKGQVFQCALCQCQWEYQGEKIQEVKEDDFVLTQQEDKPLTVVDKEDLLENPPETDETLLFPQWNSVAPISLIPEEFRPIVSRYRSTSKGTALFALILTMLVCSAGIYYYIWRQTHPEPMILTPYQHAMQEKNVLVLSAPRFQVTERPDGYFSLMILAEIDNPGSVYTAVPALRLDFVLEDGTKESRYLPPTGELIEPHGNYQLSSQIEPLNQRVIQLKMKIE